ncbi:MAG: signal peptidase I [Nitrosopumilus sp.]|nr:signal peptidase I [Nitrosopumilus sp.]
MTCKKILIAPIVICVVLILLPLLIFSGNYVMYQNSDSMYPAILPDDLLIVEQSGIEQVKQGDVIVFETHDEGIEVLVRRAIDVSENNQGILGIDTKGDHEEFHDLWTVYSDDYIGKVVEVNPSSGFLISDYFRYPLVVILAISLVLLVRESIPKKGLEVKELTCLRCGNKWHPRIIGGKVKIPSTCPNKDCRSPYWNKPRSS